MGVEQEPVGGGERVYKIGYVYDARNVSWNIIIWAKNISFRQVNYAATSNRLIVSF